MSEPGDRFREMYMSQWSPISSALYALATRACLSYDRRCDAENRNYTKISKEQIDDLYGQAVSLGWDQDEKSWRDFCYDRRDSEEYNSLKSSKDRPMKSEEK